MISERSTTRSSGSIEAGGKLGLAGGAAAQDTEAGRLVHPPTVFADVPPRLDHRL